MASTHTTNLGLNKPDRQDLVSVVNDINDNMDMIDTAVGNLDTGKVNVSDIVDNLTTNDSTKPLSAAQGYTLNSKKVFGMNKITASSLEDLKTKLTALADTMASETSTELVLVTTPAFDVFPNGTHSFTFHKLASTYYWGYGYVVNHIVTFSRAGSTWTFSNDYNTLNSNLNAVAERDVLYASDRDIIDNALLIDSITEKNHWNRPYRVSRSDGTQYLPSDCSYGMRLVFPSSSGYYSILIIGCDTNNVSSLWINTLNGGAWTGWRKVTTTSS